jgi:2-keto-4-pentenoate hydratase/2-oxohepta-3-ene-1,7-dioic acid hydratase in catechol pathway
MRLVTYRPPSGGPWRTGVLVGDVVVDAALSAVVNGAAAPAAPSVREVLGAPAERRGKLQAAAEAAAREGSVVSALAELELGPPVPDPDKVFCLGLNYHDHAAETSLPVQDVPTLFTKFRNALTGSRSPIVLPPSSREVDFEGELALVIGRRGKDIPPERVLDHVGGYMPLNDVSARDLQMRTSQWTAGKVPDTFAPCGPALVLADEVPDPHALRIETRVNGITLQSASTADMVFDIPATVSYLSRLVTLEVGDIISTGTPAGVGFTREPPVFLQDGDLVEVEIERLGVLSNPVAAAAAGSPPPRTGTRAGA